MITRVGEMNQPWYALVMKNDQPSAAVMIVKIDRHILFIDPAAMGRGSIKIRNFQSYATRYNDETEACQMFDQMIGETSRKPDTAPIFRNTHNKIIYPADLANLLQRFPRDEATYFAPASTRHAMDMIYGTTQQKTAREKALEREIEQLKASKRKKKKPRKPEY